MSGELESGAVDTQDAGRVEGTEEGGEQTPNYGGFNTPEEAVAALEAEKARAQKLSDEVEQLTQLKGRQGQAIGDLRLQAAKQQGMLQALQEAKKQSVAQGISTETIYKQLADGEIDDVQALQAMERALSTKYEGRLNEVQTEFKTFQDELKNEKYINQFLSKNPGYKEAYESGALNKWLYQGVPGETAWVEYRAERAEAKAAELEKKIEAARTAAEKAGIQKGTQLQQGKTGAAKVLGDIPAGGRLQSAPLTGLSKTDRVKAGLEYIQKRRAAGL